MRFRLFTKLLLTSTAVHAAVSFESEVKPIFEKHCAECHGPKKQKSDFRLAHRKLLQALSSGTPGEAAATMMEHVLFNISWAD